jgi:hypothetical protein
MEFSRKPSEKPRSTFGSKIAGEQEVVAGAIDGRVCDSEPVGDRSDVEVAD